MFYSYLEKERENERGREKGMKFFKHNRLPELFYAKNFLKNKLSGQMPVKKLIQLAKIDTRRNNEHD